VRLLEWSGHRVVKANHLGDWGTPFGMLIEHLLDLGADAAVGESSVGDLNAFYRAARVKFDEDPGFADRSRRQVVALQDGDEQTLRLWRLLVTESQKHFLSVYDRLDVRLSEVDFRPESGYQGQLASVVDELAGRGLLHDSQGAKVVYPQGFQGRDGGPLPLIVRKSDGGFGYCATDLAAIRSRCRDLRADRMLYFVGQEQKHHLAMIFAVAAEAGWLTPPTQAQHLSFGHVLGRDGRLLRSRTGDSIRLTDLLDEAVGRAAALLRDRPDLDDDTRAAVARAVGIGAIKYADLSNDRARDYVFDWDRMLSFTGNAGPYLQFARARILSIFRLGGVAAPDPAGVVVTEAAERTLALELLAFPTVVTQVATTLEFHRLTAHLYAVATAFTALYETCPVLKARPGVRHSRLVLCDLTARVLAQGLWLLGISAPDRM
jgi:arginyl-tRNA synthetase